jgi:hypothetical protein
MNIGGLLSFSLLNCDLVGIPVIKGGVLKNPFHMEVSSWEIHPEIEHFPARHV